MLFKICYPGVPNTISFLHQQPNPICRLRGHALEVAKRLGAMPELWISLAAVVLRSRLAVCYIATERRRRYSGQSKMHLVSLVQQGFTLLRSLPIVLQDSRLRQWRQSYSPVPRHSSRSENWGLTSPGFGHCHVASGT